MIRRAARQLLEAAIARQAAVGLLGPRQVGKTTLALDLAQDRPSLYLDLESDRDRDRLSEPVLYLQQHRDKLVILDEIHRLPQLFAQLRGVIDANRREGRRTGQFLILGSASIELLRQSSESLAGRIEYVELGPLGVHELPDDSASALWLRGGFPDSWLAASDADSLRLRQQFIRTYLERDIPQFGPRIPAETLRRFWTMLAHGQGSLLNASRLASGLGVSSPTVSAYVDLLVDLMLARRLPPYLPNLDKRLVKSPKVYLRDSGLLHALLGLGTLDELLGHPVAGASWEGFVIENLLAAAPPSASAYFFRTAAGAEIDLLLDLGPRHGLWAVEIKRSLAPKLERGFHAALDDLQPRRAFVVHAGADRYPKSERVEAVGLRALADELFALRAADGI